MKWSGAPCWRTWVRSTALRILSSARSIDEREIIRACTGRDRSLGGQISARSQAVGGDLGVARRAARESGVSDHRSDGFRRRVPRSAEHLGVRGRILLLHVRNQAGWPAPCLRLTPPL